MPLIRFVFLFVLFACNKSSETPPQQGAYDIKASFSHGGKERTYTIHLPPSFYTSATATFPVVLALHGGGGSGTQFAVQCGLNAKADSADFIVVYPDGLETPSGLRTWNAGGCCGANASYWDTDDAGFISRLIDTLQQRYRADKKKVFATGHSNGAMMCYRLANELSQKITAIAPNAGAFQIETPYNPVRPVPVLHIHSLLDENAVYGGGPGKNSDFTRLNNRPVDSCLNAVAEAAGCYGGRQTVAAYPLYAIYEWGGCASNNIKVQLYLTHDGGHSWPGGNPGRVDADPPSQAFRNNDVIWNFFKDLSL